ncbi:MAG: phosphotransferase [Desulfobacterales bacterium]|nr:MAG: phosphotransferase [Desulfobacterales bacterium]
MDLSDKQLQHLIKTFNAPKDKVDAALGGRTSIAITQLEGIGSVVVKYYYRGGLVQHINQRRYLNLGKTRCQNEYEWLKKVRTMGINAPDPIAFAYRGRLLYQGWLVTREIKHHQTLAKISHLKEKQTLDLMKAVNKQVSTLIDNRILHADLHPGNVIVDSRNQVYFLDFDKGTVFTRGKNRLRNRYARRWNRAIQKHGLPQTLGSEFKDMHSSI